jgi:hypothetical protein
VELPTNVPVSALARPVRPIRPEDSLGLAVRALRDAGGWVPVVDADGYLLGWVGEAQVYAALRDGRDPDVAVSVVMVESPSVGPEASASEALRSMSGRDPILAVTDRDGRYLGALVPSDLAGKKPLPPRPALVGGLATPFGVYLTTGSVSAGPGPLGLASTGFFMVVLLMATSAVTDQFAYWLFSRGVSSDIALTASNIASILLFFVALRLAPLSGMHGAEHMVVHAIERNEPLEPSIVRRMPRVHPRCGTNYGVGLMLFLFLGTLPFLSQEIRLLLAALVTLAVWRPLGSWVQYWLTTKNPTPAQIEAGIRSGKELLEKFARSPGRPAPLLKRLASSGLFHVMAGGWLAAGLGHWIGKLTGIPIVR